MKRVAFKLAVILLLGAIVNVAVAWGCIRLFPPTLFWNGYLEYWTEGPGWLHFIDSQSYERLSAGFPTFAVVIERSRKPEQSRNSISRFGPLPCNPLWPGFAINTFFYAAILWVLFAAPYAYRRHRRIKGGLCPACGYPVGQSDVCTECGYRLDNMKLKSRTGMGLPPPATPA